MSGEGSQLPEKNANFSKPKVDMIDFIRHQRQFMNELAMKRGQVEDLKKELEAANLKIHEISRAFELAKNTSDDYQFNLKLALQKAQFLEDQLQSKRDSQLRTRLKDESAVKERENLKDLLQKTELQNFSLNQELNELKAQHECDLAYQKELMDQDAKIRSHLTQVTEAMQKLQIDQNEVLQLSNKIPTLEEMQNIVCFYRNELNKWKHKYVELEDKFIVVNAAMDAFQKLVADNELFTVNQETQIVMSQWEKATTRFNEQTSNQKQLIENLTNTLKTEKELNTKICLREAELESKNEELQNQMEELQRNLNKILMEHKDSAVQTDDVQAVERNIKPETVEILDN